MSWLNDIQLSYSACKWISDTSRFVKLKPDPELIGEQETKHEHNDKTLVC